jgi:protocatechuate 3,4-dioxygenase beta subunit
MSTPRFLMAAGAGLALAALAPHPGAGAQAPAPIAKPAPPRLEGTVRDPAGRPVARARVIARAEGGDRFLSPLSTVTDTGGRFTLTLPRAGVYTVRVEADGLATHTQPSLRVPAAPLAIALRAGGTIEGTVRDARGRPVSAARVDAAEDGGRQAPFEARRVRTATDAKGQFRLQGLATARHTVSASARGLGGARRRGLSPGERADLVLVPGAGLSGVVRGPDWRPLPEATVRLESSLRRDGDTVETTDAAGAFQFAGLRPSQYHLIATHPDFAPSVVRVALEREEDVRVQVALGRGVRLKGRLVDENGRGVRGRVMLQEVDGALVASTLGAALRRRRTPTAASRWPGFPKARWRWPCARRAMSRGGSRPTDAAPAPRWTWATCSSRRAAPSAAGCATRLDGRWRTCASWPTPSARAVTARAWRARETTTAPSCSRAPKAPAIGWRCPPRGTRPSAIPSSRKARRSTSCSPPAAPSPASSWTRRASR